MYNKKSQDTYNNKSMVFSCCYRPGTDLPEGQRLKAYLKQTGQTANAYIKALIKRDLDAQSIPYPSDNGDNPADNPIAAPDSAGDVLPWDDDTPNAAHATHSSGSAWDVLEQIARENGYKG